MIIINIIMMFTLFLPCRDDYKNIPAIDPEKLKIFSTVREITGVCYSFSCVLF